MQPVNCSGIVKVAFHLNEVLILRIGSFLKASMELLGTQGLQDENGDIHLFQFSWQSFPDLEWADKHS